MYKRLTKICCLILAAVLMISGVPAGSAAASGETTEGGNSVTLTNEAIEMYKDTYANLSGRITDRGYSATSVTGYYSGMFPRDSSIDALAMLKYGDLDSAQKMLNYLLTYNQWLGIGYMAHILDNFQDESYGNDYLSDTQVENYSEAYDSQTRAERDLYLLNAPNNKAVQPFAVSSDSIASVRLNLTHTYSTDHIIVKILTDYQDESSAVASVDYTFGNNANGWQTVTFSEPVSVTANRRYYLEVYAENSGKVIWKGISGSGDFQSINYDLSADGGWRTGTGDITAFEIVSDEGGFTSSDVYQQTGASKDLYLLNAPFHKAVQPFTAPFTQISSIKAYLTCTDDTDRVVVRILKDYRDSSTAVAEQTFTIGDIKDGWREFTFSTPVSIEKDTTYYIEISAPEGCGKVVWKGGDAVDGYQAINYDSEAYSDGYSVDSKTTAFEVVPFTELSEQNGAGIGFSLASTGSILGASVTVQAGVAGGTLKAELRGTADGAALASAETALSSAGKNTYDLLFSQAVSLQKGQKYYLAVWTEGAAAGSVICCSAEEDAPHYNSYEVRSAAWQPSAVSFAIEPIRNITGLVQIGGTSYAQQDIPVLDGETITAVKVRVGKTESASGSLKAMLYKRDGQTLQYMDENSISLDSVGEDSELTFQFGLPLEQIVDTKSNYVIRLSAPESAADSVTWFGVGDSDQYDTVYHHDDDQTVAGDLSYTAYRSVPGPACEYTKQVDGNYMVIYAWAQFYKAAAGNAEYTQWLTDSYPLIRSLANYYLTTEDMINDDLNLMYDPCFEHSRNTQYYKGYDLITNVFASESLYEMSAIAAQLGDTENAALWSATDEQLVQGIKDNLICEIDGKTIYAELIGQMAYVSDTESYIKGFSWVNLAPIAANWHAMDTDIMINTLEKYEKFGSVDYGGYSMLDACIFINADETGLDTTKSGGGLNQGVIGKGWSWQLMFSSEQQDYDTVQKLLDFSLAYRPDSNLYTESWWQKEPGVITYSDPGNQEHASWQLYAMSDIFPRLTKAYGLDTARADELIGRAESAAAADYTEDAANALQSILTQARQTLQETDLVQAEVDLTVSDLYAALTDVLPVSRGDVDLDGNVTVSDVVELRGVIMTADYGERQRLAGDLDGNDSLTVSDVVELRNQIMKGE